MRCDRALLTMLALAFAAPASAIVFEVTGTMSGDPPGSNVPPISGSFLFRFDDSFVQAGGPSSQANFPLLELILSPNPLGNTLFDLSNTGATVYYDGGGALDSIWVGGLPDPNGVGAFNDDFRFGYRDIDTALIDASLAAAAESEFVVTDNFPSFTLSVTQVPEPGTGLLVTFGLLGLAGWRRARA